MVLILKPKKKYAFRVITLLEGTVKTISIIICAQILTGAGCSVHYVKFHLTCIYLILKILILGSYSSSGRFSDLAVLV